MSSKQLTDYERVKRAVDGFRADIKPDVDPETVPDALRDRAPTKGFPTPDSVRRSADEHLAPRRGMTPGLKGRLPDLCRKVDDLTDSAVSAQNDDDVEAVCRKLGEVEQEILRIDQE